MNQPRAQEVDLLRSFALVGICIANLPYLAMPLDALAVPPEDGADLAAVFLSAALVHGKFFVLFSFLFGWGFGVQLQSAGRRGVAPRPIYLRRLAGLLLIGIAHAALVFFGDILILYAILGLVLWSLRDASMRTLLAVAAGCVALAALGYAALGALLSMPEAVLPPAGPSGYLGGPADAVAQRLRDWTLVFPVVLLFNGPLAMGAFALGLAAHRAGFLEDGAPGFARLGRAVPLLLAVALPANLVYAAGAAGHFYSIGANALATAALAVGSPALAAVYLWAVVRAARAVPRLRPSAGRISLTGYVAQGVLAGLVFNGVGLGLFGQLGHAALFALALAIAAAVELSAALWLSRFRTGPLEMLLRRITYAGPPPSAPSASPARSSRGSAR